MLDTNCMKSNKEEDYAFQGSAPVVSIKNIMRATNVGHICNLRFYRGHILKSKKKQRKLILIIYFVWSKILPFQHVLSVKIIEIFTFFFFTLSPQNTVCVLYLQHVSICTGHISGAQ